MMDERRFDPRRRLVGAVVLVVVAIVVLPIILQKPVSPRVGQDVLTVQRGANGLTTTWSAPASAVGNPIGGGQMAPSPAIPVPAPVLVTPVHAVIKQPAVTVKPKPVVLHWFVQVGAYVNAADALILEHRLDHQGLPAHVSLVRLSFGRGIIVTVGPYRQTQARRAQAEVAARDHINGFLIQAP